MASNSEEPLSTIVEEFPAPPKYYDAPAFQSNMKPPAIPVGVNPYAKAYNGAFQKLVDGNTAPFIESKDYKAELHKSLRGIVHCAMNLVSFGDPNSNNVAEYAEGLKAAIAEFHGLLGEYREHEAREVLCGQMREQLEQVAQLEASLQRYIQYCVRL